MKILEGEWKTFEGTFELYLNDNLPDQKLITSVVSCCFYENNILLTKNSRGWELPGGHINDGENIIKALCREIKEEVGADTISNKLIGYYKLNPLKPVKRKEGGFYPFPHGYIPFYLCECDNIQKYTGDEILDTRILKITDIDTFDFINKESVKLLLKYRKTGKNSQ